MSWTDQDPPATDVILQFRHEAGCYIEIDKLPGGYRATAGNLFGSREIAQHTSLDALLREVQALSKQGA